MKRLLSRFPLILVLALSACAPAVTIAQELPSALPLPEATPQPTPTSLPPAGDKCPTTLAVEDQPPDDPHADSFGFGLWFINADRTMWAYLDGGWAAGKDGNKVIWIRPAGTQLLVSGRRLDGEAPPLRADIPCCYTTGFQVTGLYFPTGGCWEVAAEAGEHHLQFVVEIPISE